jgi:hypothetical protein
LPGGHFGIGTARIIQRRNQVTVQAHGHSFGINSGAAHFLHEVVFTL